MVGIIYIQYNFVRYCNSSFDENEFEKQIKDNDIIVQLSADWCGPCKVLTPVLESVANEKSINVVKVNIDSCPSVVQKYSVRSIPRILFIKAGLVSDDLTGNQSRAKIEEACQKVYGV